MAGHNYIVFQLGNERYALDSTRIKEIGRTKEIAVNHVPKTPDYIEGIINLRGDIVPLIHLKRMFGIGPPPKEMPKRLIIVGIRAAYYGLLVDRVFGHIQLDDAQLLPPTEEIKNTTPYIQSIAKQEEMTCFIIDLDRLF